MPFELRPEPHPPLRPEGEYLQRAWSQSVYPLARMLGVHRPRVSTVAGALQRAGLIRYVRGRITVLDREGLEATACECYRVIRGEYDRLLD